MKLKLATRLSAFFLVAAAGILLCFSTALFASARIYLYQRLDERLRITLDVLEASIDIEPEGMEWEPTDRRLNVGIEAGAEQTRWAIYDHSGVVVGRSANAASVGFPPSTAWGDVPRDHLDGTSFLDTADWRLAGRTLRLGELLNPDSPPDTDGAQEDDVQHEQLLLVAGASPVPVQATLRRLWLSLAGGSAAIWTICAVLGWRLATWAMLPVRKLAFAAKQLAPDDAGWRLPPPGTADELDDMAGAFNQLLTRLQEAFERQRRFTGQASHQLRTPLAGILGQLDVALRRDRSAGEYRRVLSAVRDESRRLGRIVDSLLLLSRAEAGESCRAPKPLEFKGWLRECLSRWSEHPRRGDLHCQSDDEREAWIRADPDLLVQVIDNLLENALKYSTPGSRICISVSCSSETAQLTVEDFGAGISADDLPHVFQPFYRSDAARLSGTAGHGLGLSLAQRIIEVHAGTLTVESTLGQGSRFVARLPLVPRPAGHAEALPHRGPHAAAEFTSVERISDR